MRGRTAAAPLVAAVLALLATAPAGAAFTPHDPPLIHDGPTGRALLDGPWLRHADRGDVGLRAHWERRPPAAGWVPVRVPNAWNATDLSSAGFIGAPVWYRTTFRLPSASSRLAWHVRFEAVNYRATVWLNGRLIGEHAGSYLPFELVLAGVRRRGDNRLVVRVDNRRLPTDFPPSIYTSTDEPHGGWWNWGGIVREVELRPVDRVDLEQVQAIPRLGCAGCPASVSVRAVVRNVSSKPERVRLSGLVGGVPVRFRAVQLRRGGARIVAAVARVARPHLWWPADPYLYPLLLTAEAAARGGAYARAAGYRLHVGLRTVRVGGDGSLQLNGTPVHLRGVGLHEDVPGKGPAMDDADRAALLASVKALGATLVRAHYPLHPELEELADREGVLLWSEVPVYRLVTQFLGLPAVTDAAVEEVRQNVIENRNHASVIVWSVGNELQPGFPGAVRRYIARAAAAAHALDPSRPVGMAIEAHREDACRAGLAPLDVIGANEYFGWYGGTNDDLSPYLDELRRCHPHQALLVTEFGAEANRDGPVDEKGTYEFQRAFITAHLATINSKPWLSGASYWALREFVCAPNWAGGNPLPSPPMHKKGVLTYQGQPKPAYADLQQAYRSTVQVPGPPPPS
jgi:beta-glucuronidase